jgi:hypothetical protein
LCSGLVVVVPPFPEGAPIEAGDGVGEGALPAHGAVAGAGDPAIAAAGPLPVLGDDLLALLGGCVAVGWGEVDETFGQVGREQLPVDEPNALEA